MMNEHVEAAKVVQEAPGWATQAWTAATAAGGAWLGKHLLDSFRGPSGLKSLREGQQANTERIVRIETKLEAVATREDVLKAVNSLGETMLQKMEEKLERLGL